MVTYVKISELPIATEATGDSELEVNQAGVTRKITVDQIADVIAAILPPPDMSDYATDEELADAIAAVELLPGPPGPAGPAGADGATGATGPPGTTSWTGITDKPSTFPPDPEAVDDRVAALIVAGSNMTATYNDVANTLTLASTASGGGGGTVTSTSVVSANGLAGTVATPTTTPAITLSTTIVGMLKGNGTAISAGTAGTDYVIPGALAGYQPLDSGLTALSSIGTGIVANTAADTFAGRTITGTASRVTITNGNGVAGNPTIDIAAAYDTALAAAYQPLDSDLTALAGLNATAGLVEQTAAAAFTKRAMGVANATDVLTRAGGDGRYLGIAASAPPSGTAGGDLSGTYPNPLVKPSVTNGQVLTTVAGVAAWAAAAGGASVTIGDTAPGSPSAGNLWWESDSGKLLIYFNDGNTSQWVEANSSAGPQGPPGVWVQMTQAAYDALTPKVSTTLYIIIG